jgi:DNA repair protein RecN (Recombination protein N)
MLEELVVKDLAIIRDARIHFTDGLNVVSGASGVGKSLLVHAILLSLGARASASIVRSDREEARIEARFHLSAEAEAEIARLLGTPLEEHDLVVRRTVSRDGRSRAAVNGSLVSVTELRAIGERLADVHGQNDEQLLARPAVQERLLDEFGRLAEARKEFGETLRLLRDLDDRAAARARRLADVREREDLLRHQLREIDEVGVQAGELRALTDEVSRIRHAARIREYFGKAVDSLDETEGSALARGRALESGLDALAREVEALSPLRDQLREWIATGEDLAAAFRAEAERIDLDEARAVEAEDRLDAVRRLLRKYGPTEEDVLARSRSLAADLDGLERANETAGEEEDKRRALLSDLDRLGGRLTKERRAAARRLAAGVSSELADVGLVGARFEVRVDTVPLDQAMESGLDRIGFYFSANAGEPPRPLGSVASGGETSRVMLALRSQLSAADPFSFLVFDEMDAAVGARFGHAVGEKLRALSRTRQVICVTHLPQVAAFAHHHVRAEKEAKEEGVAARFSELSEEERIIELAQMIKGSSASAASLEQARELLEEAREERPKKTARSGPARRSSR